MPSTSTDNDEECDPKPSKKKKKSGRKAHWSDNTLDDFIDIIVSNTSYQQKLIFTNTKNKQNGILYGQILKELKKRCSSRNETIDFTIPQLRNKFKKCVSECKRVAMTIKTATGIKRLQEDKGYSAWFDKLFPHIQSRDSCQPHLAVEPSYEEEESDKTESTETEGGVKQFVPTKKKKVTPKDQVGEAVELFKTVLERDATTDIINYMRDEAERARQHELELTKLILNSVSSAPTAEIDYNQPNYMQQQYSHVPSVNYQHHNFQFHQPPSQHFPPTNPTNQYMNPDDAVHSVPKCYHTL